MSAQFHREKPKKKKDEPKVPRAPQAPRAPRPPAAPIVQEMILENTQEVENIYLDCVFTNSSLFDYQNVVFDATRNVPILQERSDYKLGVISVNGLIRVPLLLPLGEITIGVTFTVGGVIYTVPHTYVDNTTYYTVEDFVFNFNRQLQLLWVAAQAAFILRGVLLADRPLIPGLTYNNGLFTITGDQRMESIAGSPFNPNSIALYIEPKLAALLDGIWCTVAANRYSRVNFVANYHDSNVVQYNPGPGNQTYYEMKQDSPSIGSWLKTNSLIITSDSLGGRPVEVAKRDNLTFNTTSEIRPIIDSFPLNLTGGINRTILYANPNINYVDILTTGALNRVSFALEMSDANGNIIPLALAPRSTIIVKFVFSKTLFVAN